MSKTTIKKIFYLYAICFLIGGLRHWVDIARDGIFPYTSVPLIFNVYLTSLAILDFIVIILLFVKPIPALMLAMIIMASDLMVDFYLSYHYWGIGFTDNVGLQLLVLFGVFLFCTAPFIMRRLK